MSSALLFCVTANQVFSWSLFGGSEPASEFGTAYQTTLDTKGRQQVKALDDVTVLEQDSATGLYKEPVPPECPPRFPGELYAKGPKDGYPTTFNLMKMLKNWEPDDTTVPKNIYNSLRYFNFSVLKERAEAEKFRNQEVPFVIHGIPAADEVVKKWTLSYVEGKLGTSMNKVEVSKNNHMMYWSQKHLRGRPDPNYQPPTENQQHTFKEWLQVSQVPHSRSGVDQEHWYYRMDAKGGRKNSWVQDDLDGLFAKRKSFFIVDPHGHRGINCRFGMRGVIAETHYDGSRNMVAMLKGAKRYMLQPPGQCHNMYYYPSQHPSSRHSMVDWSEPQKIDRKKYPKFWEAEGLEVVMKPGQVLYIPAFWNHYIISLGVNVQCNTRSGLGSTSHADSRAVEGCI